MTYLDAAIIGVVLVQGLIASRHGFARAALGIVTFYVSLIVATLATMYVVVFNFRGFYEGVAANLSVQVPIVQIAAFNLVFWPVRWGMSRGLRAMWETALSEPKITNLGRVFGFTFGAAWGLLVVLVFSAFTYMKFKISHPDLAQWPAWVRESKALPLIQGVSNQMSSWLGITISP